MHTVRTGPLLGLLATGGLLAVLSTTAGLSGAGWTAGLACGLATFLLLHRALARHGASGLGPANRITLTRATLVAGITALIASSFGPRSHVGVVVGLTAVALALDAVDGRVARHTGTTSALGARFDMEVDAFLILVLSVYVSRPFGAWVLAIGAARYVYVAAGWALPWLREPVPARYWSKVVAAIQGITLTAAAARPGLAEGVAVGGALALLAESFGHDVRWLSRRRHVADSTARPDDRKAYANG